LWNLPDGIGITTLIRLNYGEKVKRITGNDIFPVLLKIANKHSLNLALVGSSEDVLIKSKEKINNKYSNLKDRVLTISPLHFFERNKDINDEVVQTINNFKPDIVLAALGCPRQEIWLWNNMNQFGSKINIGVGAVFDYYSGIKKRSPRFLQKTGLEWLWRLLSEPGRLFKRYFLLDLPYIIKQTFSILCSKSKS
jgi:N-acetylglucosaminyldiphosphoundecaprenol N-acetyl-beta-D-mannosaminyltransferase